MLHANENISYVYAFLFFLSIANGITYLMDFIEIGKSYSYRATCDTDKKMGYTIGKGWTCTKNYNSMLECFNKWKIETNQPNDCKLARIFQMKIYHVHRWLHYLLDSRWHHPYINIGDKLN